MANNGGSKKPPSSPETVVVADLGNSLLKVVHNDLEPDNRREIVVPHALVPISDAEFERIKSNFGGTLYGEPSYFSFDGNSYVVGEYAEQYGAIDRRSSNFKYTRDYYGALFVAVMLRLFPEGNDNLRLFVCHPPSDSPYRDQQMAALKGKFQVQTSGQEVVEYRVRYVNTFAEPIGGYMNVMLDEYGRRQQDVNGNRLAGINNGRVLIFDVGGKISSIVPAMPDGGVEYDRARSVDVGILDVLEQFEANLRLTYYEDFARTRTLPTDRLRRALREGVYMGGGKARPCKDEADKAMNILLNRLRSPYFEKAGGPTHYDHILITGGGGGAAANRMREELLEHASVLLSERPDDMHMANVRGGAKLWLMLNSINSLK